MMTMDILKASNANYKHFSYLHTWKISIDDEKVKWRITAHIGHTRVAFWFFFLYYFNTQCVKIVTTLKKEVLIVKTLSV